MIEINGTWIAIHWIKTMRIVNIISAYQLKIDIGNISELSFEFSNKAAAEAMINEVYLDCTEIE